MRSHRHRKQRSLWTAQLSGILSVVLCVTASALLFSACKSERTLDSLESSLTDEMMQRWETPSGDTLGRIKRLFIAQGREVGGEDEVIVRRRVAVDRPFDLGAGQCTAAIAVSDEGKDIDLFLYSPDGQIVARDEGSDSFPVIERYCASTTGTFAYRIRASRETTVRWRRYLLEVDVGDGMLEQLRDRYGDGARAAIAPQTNALRESGRFETPFVAESGRCYRILGAGLDNLGDLDVYVRNAEHALDVQELAVGPSLATREICVDETQQLTIEFRAHRGDGRFRWQILERQAPRGVNGPDASNPEQDDDDLLDSDAADTSANPSTTTGPLREP